MSDIRHSWLKTLSIGTGAFLTASILIVLILIVTYPGPQNLFNSFFSEEIIFAVHLSLLTYVISTGLCIILGVPAAYALARYRFPGKNLVTPHLTCRLHFRPWLRVWAFCCFLVKLR